MYVYTHIYAFIYLHIYVYIQTYIYLSYICIFIYIRTHAYLYVVSTCLELCSGSIRFYACRHWSEYWAHSYVSSRFLVRIQ